MSVPHTPLDLFKIDWPVSLSNMAGFPAECLSEHSHVDCPICNTRKAFRFSNYQGEGNWICKTCGAGKGPRLVHEVLGIPYAEVFRLLKGENVTIVPIARQKSTPLDDELTEKEITKNRVALTSAWRDSFKMRNHDAAWRYLEIRVPLLDLTRIDPSFRLHRKMDLYEEIEKKVVLRGSFPTMLAIVTDPDGTFITMHRTFLTNKGTKVPYEHAKKQMGGLRKLKGAGIHLVTVPGCRTLAVGEGIETMLAVATMHHYQINVRSYLNAGNLAKANISRSEFDKVIIYADHDMPDRKGRRPGEYYAQQLSKRLMEMGFIVEIRLPEIERTDWADVWMDVANRFGNFLDKLLTNVIQQQTDDPYSLIKNMLHHSM